jgi:hypothetical protein
MEQVWPLIYSFIALILTISAITIIPTLLLLAWVVWQVKKINLPADADFMTALRATPLVIVVLLDLLDLTFNFMSAPISWVILTYLGLQPLRGVTIVEDILPGTELIPTMTAAWIMARVFKDRN